jgi:hypothetical protein
MTGRPKRRIATGVVAVSVAVLAACGNTQRSSHEQRGDAARPPAPSASASSRSARPKHRKAEHHKRKQPAPPLVTTKRVDRLQQHGSRRAVVVLRTLPVKGRAPMTGYSREQFGPAWTDDNNDPLGHNGCDTRNDILRRDLVSTRLEPATGGCVVETGVLRDPYTSHAIHFRRGEVTSLAVQIDHVVALGDAWQTGAQRWSLQTRTDLANDPLELLAVDGPTNEAKGDGDAATWLPPNAAYRCSYVARQIAVKARYRLWVTPAEHDAMARVLGSCPGQKVPREATAPTLVAAGKNTKPSASSHVYYANCTAAEAAGAAPIYRGQPGYRPELDGDGDGVACEG